VLVVVEFLLGDDYVGDGCCGESICGWLVFELGCLVWDYVFDLCLL